MPACHPSNGLRGSSVHLGPQVSSKVLHALSTGQPGTVQLSPSPLGLQNPGRHNQPQSRRIIAKDEKDIPSDPLANDWKGFQRHLGVNTSCHRQRLLQT